MPIFHNPLNPITFILLFIIIAISFNRKIRDKLLNKSLNKDRVNGSIIILSILITILFTDRIGKTIKDAKLRQRPWVEQTQENMNCPVCTINESGEYQSGGRYKSMPSNHSANTISLAFILSLFFPKIKITAYTFALIIMISRIYIGVHYPSDIIAGMILGLLCSIFLSKGILFYINNKKILN